MKGLAQVVQWFEKDVVSKRQSCRKILAAIIEGTMRLQGSGILALGRSMSVRTAAKHCIERVQVAV